ncbi:MAG: amidohydrolase family protein [Gemmatimonadota bacterium]|nr:amidohydrolase family protein [Gemmatimonadota bacterium]MDQ8173109.1 amidohydrolase family protein [Gemmatimonadota bacterium]
MRAANPRVLPRMVRRVKALGVAVAAALAGPSLGAQRAPVGPATRSYVAVDTTVLALINARVIDGTGAPPREGQTLIIRDGRITAIGATLKGATATGRAGGVAVPAGAQVIDLAGKSVMPGLVMVHEHLYYPVGAGTYGNLTESFSRLYLAGGVTSMRTGGNMNGFAELLIAKAIARGEKPGPWIDATAPYLEGPGMGFNQVAITRDSVDARKLVEYWADQGATSFKAYMNISRAALQGAARAAHARGLKITGHLCSVTYREAADAGIDDLEHGFFAMNDFVPGKQPDTCSGRGGAAQSALAQADPESAEVQALFRYLIERKVAVTSTLTIFETFTPGRPMPPGTDVLIEPLRAQFAERYAATQRNPQSVYARAFPKGMAMERAFVKAGGTLIVGTDPTGGGGVIAGYSNQRALELLVEAGFSPLEAIRIGTLNGATYLGRGALTGSLVTGKLADFIIVNGNPDDKITDIRNIQMVFRQGVGYDPAALIASVKGKVGLW